VESKFGVSDLFWTQTCPRSYNNHKIPNCATKICQRGLIRQYFAASARHNRKNRSLCAASGRTLGLDDLTKRIEDRLSVRKSCIVFENEITRVWPLSKSRAEIDREKEIHAFAEKNGWSAKINDPGIRVTFKKP
jgi:hypothetical protein